MSYPKDYKECCPHCGEGGEMFVTKITMVQTGRTLEIHTKLLPDGFEFDPNDNTIRDHSTTDEKVTCEACGIVMDLTELTN